MSAPGQTIDHKAMIFGACKFSITTPGKLREMFIKVTAAFLHAQCFGYLRCFFSVCPHVILLYMYRTRNMNILHIKAVSGKLHMFIRRVSGWFH